jgi:transposase-like protein
VASTLTIVKTKAAGQGEATWREISLSFRLKDLINNKSDVWKISDRLNVYPSTVQKILDGNPISRSVTKKIETAFEAAFDGNGAIEKEEDCERQEPNRSSVERFMVAYDLYSKEKSLRAVGKKLGISHERVRQLLEKGSEVGLFEYSPPNPRPAILSRQKILKDYGKYLHRKEVAKQNRISSYYLSRFMEFHHITKTDLEAIRHEGQQRQCIEQYQAVATRLGHPPTSAELLRSKLTRPLALKIRRMWGSFGAFQSELNGALSIPQGSSSPSSHIDK